MSKEKLKKEIGFLTAITVVVGTVIGSGVFFKPEAVFSATGGAPGLGVLAWLLGGIITICGGLTAAEISAAIPKTGGMIAYMEKVYGDIWGYVLGWAQTLVYFPANIAALSIIFGTQVASLLGFEDRSIIFTAIIVCIFLFFMNSLGARTAGRIQLISTVCKLIPLALIIIFGLMYEGGGVVRLFPITVESHPVMTSIGSAIVATMFAYDGWINVGAIAGEMKNPTKDLPRAIVGGLSIVMAVYLFINIAYLFVVPASTLAGTNTPASDVAYFLFGRMGGKFVTIGILISVFGTINGYMMTGIRVPYAMATQNKLPGSKWLGKLHPKTKVPVNSGILIIGTSILFMLSGGFNRLTDLVVFVIWIFYTMTFIAVFILRKKEPNLTRPYRVPLYPIIPLIAIVGGVFIVINTIITQPLNAGVGLFITALGIPLYYIRRKHFIGNEEEITDEDEIVV